MFPIEVTCPKCGESLMDGNHPLEGFPSVYVNVQYKNKKSDLWLSSLYGSYRGHKEQEIPRGSEVTILCPFCGQLLSDGPPCLACEAKTVILEMEKGGMVRFCSRYGCRKHAIAFSDIGGVVVASIMNRYIVSVYSSDNLITAVETLVNYEIAGVPVLGDDEMLTGLLTEDRILELAYPESFRTEKLQSIKRLETIADWQNIKCGDVCIKNPLVVSPDSSLIEAGRLMVANNKNILLVIKENTLVGILSKSDIFRALLREKLG